MGDQSDRLKGNTDSVTWNNTMPDLVWTIYFLSSFLLVTIMLNLLIAFIGDSYEKVVALERYNQNFERANLLLEIDLSYSKEYRSKLMDKYLYFSCCSKDQDEVNEQDRIRSVVDFVKKQLVSNKKAVRDQLVESEKNVKQDINLVQNEMKILNEEFECFEDEIFELKSEVKQMKDILKNTLIGNISGK